MERIVLIVWVALMAGTLAGGADDHQRAVPVDVPSMPIPAGDTLSSARARSASRTPPDGHVRNAHRPTCMTGCGGDSAEHGDCQSCTDATSVRPRAETPGATRATFGCDQIALGASHWVTQTIGTCHDSDST